jgi:hypothetical protein
MDSLSIGIQVSGYFWTVEKSTKFTKMWQHFFVISQKNDSLSISIQISMDTWISEIIKRWSEAESFTIFEKCDYTH